MKFSKIRESQVLLKDTLSKKTPLVQEPEVELKKTPLTQEPEVELKKQLLKSYPKTISRVTKILFYPIRAFNSVVNFLKKFPHETYRILGEIPILLILFLFGIIVLTTFLYNRDFSQYRQELAEMYMADSIASAVTAQRNTQLAAYQRFTLASQQNHSKRYSLLSKIFPTKITRIDSPEFMRSNLDDQVNKSVLRHTILFPKKFFVKLFQLNNHSSERDFAIDAQILNFSKKEFQGISEGIPVVWKHLPLYSQQKSGRYFYIVGITERNLFDGYIIVNNQQIFMEHMVVQAMLEGEKVHLLVFPLETQKSRKKTAEILGITDEVNAILQQEYQKAQNRNSQKI